MATPASLPLPPRPDGSLLESVPARPPSARHALAALTAEIARIAEKPWSRGTVEVALRAALEFFGAQFGAIWMFRDAPGEMTLIGSSGPWGDATLPPRCIRLDGEGVHAAVARTRAPLCLSRPQEVERYLPAEAWLRGLSSVLCVPLLAHEDLLGSLLIAARQPHAFDAADVALAAALGQLVAPALGRSASDGESDPLHAGAGRTLTASLDLDEVLTLLVERAAAATGADAAGVLEADAGGGALRFRRTHGLTPRYSEGFVLPAGAGIAGAALVGGRPLWTADILADPRFSIPEDMRSRMAAERLRGILAAPIRGRQGFDGVLTLYWRVPRAFGDGEITVAAQIAAQAAIAIEHARLYRAKVDVARQQAALLEIGATLNAAIMQEGTLQLIIDKAVETLGADKGTLFAYDPATQELAIVAARGLSSEGMGFRLRMGESAAGRAILWRRPVVVRDVEADTDHDIKMDHVRREGIRALLILPLVTGDEVVGAISLAHSQPTRFSEEDIALLTLFAHQAAVALRNARLFEDLARSRAEIARHKEQLQELYRLGVAMQSAISLRERLDLILQGVHGVLGLDRIAIFLCDRGKEVLECRAAFGELDEPVEQIKLPLDPGGGILAKAFREGREVLWTDDRDLPPDLRLGPPYSDIQTLRAHSFLIFPLISRGGTIGLLVADNKRNRASFSNETLSLLRTFAAQAAIAIENARLLDRQREEAAAAERQRAQAEALAAVGQAISASLDLDEVLSLLVGRAAATTGASAAAVLERETPTGSLRFRKAQGLSHRYLDGLIFSSPAGVSGAALGSGRAHCTADVLADPGYAYPAETRARMAAEGIRGLLSVPIRGGDGPYGVLNLYWQDPHPCTEEETTFATRIADQAAIAIENARLFQREQERRRQVEAVRAVSEEITRELDLATVLNLINLRATDLLRGSAGTVWLWNEADQALAPRAWRGYGEWLRDERRRLGEGVVGAVALRREGVILNEFRAWPHAPHAILERSPVAKVAAEPLLYRERLIGVIIVDRLEGEASFAEEDRKLLALFAAQAAVAIENARLFQQEQERRRQVEAVRAVTEEITRELDLPALLGLIHRRAMELVGASSGCIHLWDEAAQVLVPKAWHGLGDWMQEVRFRLGEGISGVVAQRREGFAVNDYRSWPQASPLFLERTGVTATLGEPLLYGDRLIGVITVDSQEAGRTFSEQDREVLGLFAAQAAIAIENARLYAQTREALDELAAIHEAGRAIAQSLDLQETLQHILAAAMRLTDTDKGIVTLLDEERQELVGIAFAGVTGHSEVRVPLSEQGFAVECFRTGRVLTSEDPENDPRCSPSLQARFGNKSLIAVPLRSGDRVIGVFDVGDLKRRRQFTPRQIAILERLAQHAVVAIENARLYAQTRKAYEDLRAAQEQLVRVEKLKALGELSAGVAHDFNNLLAAILGRAQLLRMRSTDPQLRQGLEVIERAALDGAETVRRILGFARAGSEAEYAPVDLMALIPQVLEVTRPRWKDEAQQRGAAIEAELVLEPVPAVRGNAAELREVLVNLVFNAVDAMPQGGHLTIGTRRLWRPGPAGDAVNPHLEVLADQREEVRELVEIFVRDTGLGMSEAVRRRAFDPFFTTKGVKGSGLGLSVVYGIVSRHGGEVILESEERTGTTVAIRLPATTQAPAAADEPTLSPAPRTGRIVVLDDEGVLAETLADVLRLQRHQVEVFTDPRAALAHLAHASADLLFTDLGMPDMSGWDVAQEARRLHPQLPVVLVTGWGYQIDPAQVRESRVNAMVSKPYRVQDIIRVVAEVLPARPTP